MTSRLVIQTDRLTKRFGNLTAVDDRCAAATSTDCWAPVGDLKLTQLVSLCPDAHWDLPLFDLPRRVVTVWSCM